MKNLLVSLLIIATIGHAQKIRRASVRGIADVGRAPVAAGIALVAGGNTLCALASGGSVVIGPFDATGGNTVFAWAAHHPAGPPSISDSQSNTYTQLTDTGGGSAPDGRSWAARGATVSASFTVTITNPVITGACVAVFSGLASSGAADSQNHAAEITGTTVQPGSVTYGASSIVFAAVYMEGTVSLSSINSSYTTGGTVTGDGIAGYGVGWGWKLESGTGTENPTITVTPTSTKDASAAVFH